MPIDLFGFFVLSALVIVTPGQDTMLTIRNTLLGGRRGGAFTALGVACGQALWTLATSAGVAAMLVASRTAFTAVRVAGALYLVALGLRGLIAAWRSGRGEVDVGRATPVRPISGAAAFRQG